MNLGNNFRTFLHLGNCKIAKGQQIWIDGFKVELDSDRLCVIEKLYETGREEVVCEREIGLEREVVWFCVTKIQ